MVCDREAASRNSREPNLRRVKHTVSSIAIGLQLRELGGKLSRFSLWIRFLLLGAFKGLG